jgi:hypothetical protein
MLKRLLFAACLSLNVAPSMGNSQASDWLLQAQVLASTGNDAEALALLWQHFPQQAEATQAEGLLLAAELCARNGLIELARSYYLQRLQHSAASIASGDRYAIARFFADQQEWQRSIDTLHDHWQQFPRGLKEQARLLLGIAQLNSQQTQPALQTLRFKRHQVKPLAYRRYNLAVAEYRLGKTFEARQRLHKLLLQNPHSLEQALFNDRLRVQLAQHYLRHQQGRFARPLLTTVKYQSPYANQALLMLGWAALTPGGELPKCQQLNGAEACWIEVDQHGHDIQRSQTSISQTFAKLRPQPQQTVAPELLAQLQTAISSWQILAEKQPSAVDSIDARLAQLEGKVSLAYGLQISGQWQRALKQYQRALADIEQQLAEPHQNQRPQSYAKKLQNLAATLENHTSLSSAIKSKALRAIKNARHYRQRDVELAQQQQHKQWQPVVLEYKKQAHLGLASLHEQMSYQ